MGRTAPRKQQAERVEAPREVVSEDVYANVDFEAFNSKVAAFRQVTDSEGFSSSFSKFTDVPTTVVSHDGRTL